MEALQFSPLTEHEQDSLHLSLLGGRVELTRVEPQFLPPGEWKAVIYQFGLKTTSDLVFQRKPFVISHFFGRFWANSDGRCLCLHLQQCIIFLCKFKAVFTHTTARCVNRADNRVVHLSLANTTFEFAPLWNKAQPQVHLWKQIKRFQKMTGMLCLGKKYKKRAVCIF